MMNQEFKLQNARDGPEEHPSYLPAIAKTPNGAPIEKVYNILTKDEQLPSAEVFRGTATYNWVTTDGSITIRIRQCEEFEKVRKRFFKLFIFFLQKVVLQDFPDTMYFSLQELVDLGMYTRASSARRAVDAFARIQDLISVERTYKRKNHGKEEIITAHYGVFLTNIETDSKGVTCDPNNELISLAVCSQYTVLPRFVFKLNDNAYALAWYIFYMSRQKLSKISQTGYFHIGLDTIRRRLGLPSVGDIKNREYKKLIIDPILAAINELQIGFADDASSQCLHASIEIHDCRPDNIREWLQGYITVHMDASSSEGYQKYVKNAERRQRQIEMKKAQAQERALEISVSAL